MSASGISRRGSGRAMVTFLLVGVMALVLAGCQAVYRNHGYVPNEEELALIEVGKDTRESVGATLGHPGAQGLLNDVGWYYVQSRWKHYGAMAPQEIDRQTVAITFSEDGIVENVERFGLEDGKVVAISRRVTESNIKGMTFLRQLMGNIGRISANNIID